jgi:hypothetical protein
MSTQSRDRHHLGSPWVAFFGRRIWVLGTRLQTCWRSWVAQCTSEGGHRMWVVGIRVGCQGTQVGCQWRPPGQMYFGLFLPIPLMGLHSPRVTATQAETDSPWWTGLCTNMKYCSIQNPSVGGSNICLYTQKLCLWPWLPHICGEQWLAAPRRMQILNFQFSTTWISKFGRALKSCVNHTKQLRG